MASDPTFVLDEISATELRVASSPPAVPPDIAIRANGVGKMYRIYDRPQDRLKQMMFWRFGRSYGREFWALREASFEIERGEAVGIIGRNGSGKSTMLQMITGTLEPTCGSVEVQGRVAALLELGSGFNPEFTGRENVFLNGAVLGISQEEIAERFDTIAAFADIGDFIEQPVKLYSSGMLVRLAFAVQAHLDPDVLIVDEALSVGDIYFQHKCMRHIKRLIDRGTTLLFVSHDIETVRRFCRRGIWLDSGEVRAIGAAGEVADKYLAFMRMREEQDVLQEENAQLSLPEPSDLPWVTGAIDLRDDRFFRGNWQEGWSSHLGRLVRSTRDADALAGFRVGSGLLTLEFIAGPQCADAMLIVDRQPRPLDLHHQGEAGIRQIAIELGAGEHTVVLQAVVHAVAPLQWVGGTLGGATHLDFRRDPAFDPQTGQMDRYGNGKAFITAVELVDAISGMPVQNVRYGQQLKLRVYTERQHARVPRTEFSIVIRDRNRVDLFGATTLDEGVLLDESLRQWIVEFGFTCHLGPGSYSILVAVVEASNDADKLIPMDCIDIAYVFEVGFDKSRPVWYLFHEPVEIKVFSE